MKKYYDGTKLLSLLDLNKKKPEIFICTSNRSAGKTTYFNKLVLDRFIKTGEKFCLLYRFNYELDNVVEKYYKDIGSLFFDGEMKSERRCSGIYHELFYNGRSCGYAMALNNADQIKKYSHLFSDVSHIIFDEFQSETNHYCSNEVKKFISIHTSIARGQGNQVRHVPVYMISNPVSLINPYYTEMEISGKLHSDTKFLRGDGYVLEQGFNASASEAQKSSAFNRAFSKNTYTAYSSEGIYLNDSTAFIAQPTGKCRYICTLKYLNKHYAIREYASAGVLYCDDNADMSFPIKICITTDDHQINYVMLKRNDFMINNLRYLFERGSFRFKNLQAKEAVLKVLSY